MDWSRPRSAVASLFLALAVASPFAYAQQGRPEAKPISADDKAQVLQRVEEVLSRQAFVPGIDFTKFDEVVAAQKEAIQKAKTEFEFARAVNAAMRQYGFSHINLFPPDFGTQRTTQKRAGIGITLEIEDKGIRVTNVFEDSPAATAGIQTGDLIVQSDGKPVRERNDLLGDKGSTSNLVVERGTKKVKVKVTRGDYVPIVPESLTWDGDVAILKIPTFDVGYNAARVDKLMADADKAKKLVIDLRSNGGGRVSNLLHLAAHFFDRDSEPLGTFVTKNLVTSYERDNPPTKDVVAIATASKPNVRAMLSTQPKFTGKVAVLVNGGTGSASEMLAAALKEIKGAELFGTKTAGAVLASILTELPRGKGFWIQYPLTDYVTIRGVRIEGNGLEPSKTAPDPHYGEADEPLIDAKHWLASVIRSTSSR
ncbi:MAG: PDZ domain-containing protein [Armatimonadetes bacterium]|nr:PDZ domain-containing protein [Armatimonadota bacterium]